MQKLISYPFKETLRIDYFPLLRNSNDHQSSIEKNNKEENHLQEINNHLKSPAEIEAEFILRTHEKKTKDVFGNTATTNAVRQELEKEQLNVTIDIFSLNLPVYMEENY